MRTPSGCLPVTTRSSCPAPRACGPTAACRRIFAEEAAQAWRNVAAALSAAGAELTDIVSVRQWLTSADDIPVYAAVRKEIIKHEPVFMLGVIPGLVWPKLRVEIEVTAVVRPPA
jgi:2-iminobutanoate/2-iminopropanoate deaminase